MGVREDTGDPCNRSASGGSDFCFAHRPQEGNRRIIDQRYDVYHCPDDGQELKWLGTKKNRHRCDTCGGVLMSGKEIAPVLLENILELPEALDEGSVVECPTCIPDSGQAEGEVSLSNFTVEWQFFGRKELGFFDVTYHGVSNVGHCEVCGSTWFSGPGEHDALGRKIPMYTKKEVWRNLDYRTTELFGEHAQSFLRDERVKRVIAKEEKEGVDIAAKYACGKAISDFDLSPRVAK